MFNIRKYKKMRFSKEDAMDRKIKALYLFFDKKVEELNLNRKQTIESINHWIQIFIKNEEYELADAFKKRKIIEWRKGRKIKRILSARLFYRVWRIRIKKFFKKIKKN